jgi:hypothetical protein
VTGVAVVTHPMTLVIGIPVVNDLISIHRICVSDASATETEFLKRKRPESIPGKDFSRASVSVPPKQRWLIGNISCGAARVNHDRRIISAC